MTKMYTPSVPRDNLPKKSICSYLLVQLFMQKVVWNTKFHDHLFTVIRSLFRYHFRLKKSSATSKTFWLPLKHGRVDDPIQSLQFNQDSFRRQIQIVHWLVQFPQTYTKSNLHMTANVWRKMKCFTILFESLSGQ